MIRYDTTQRSTVAVCSCGARDVHASQAAAKAWASRHLLVCTLRDAEHRRALAARRVDRSRYR